MRKNQLKTEYREVSIIISLLFSGSIILGHSGFESGRFSSLFASNKSIVLNSFMFLLLGCISFILIQYFFLLLDKQESPCHKEAKWGSFFSTTQGMVVLWGIIFLLWLPCFLAYYPGIYSYDIVGQNNQVITGVYSSHHPPLHTFLWKICMMVETKTGIPRVSVYCLGQMTFLSGAFAYMLRFLVQKGIPRLLFVLSLLFFCCNPVMAIISCLPTKDCICAGFFVLLSVTICDLIAQPENLLRKKERIRAELLLLLFCLFRNNAIYSVIICGIVVFLISKETRKEIALLILIPMLAYILINKAIFPMLGIQNGSWIESFSIPLQQIASVCYYHGDELDEKSLEMVLAFFCGDLSTIKELFNPRFADPIKDLATTEYGIKPIILCWVRLLVKYPKEYISSFLTMSLPYWYPFSSPMDPISGRLFLETYANSPDLDALRNSLWPFALRQYERVAQYHGSLVSVFPFSLISSVSMPLWVLLIGLARLARKIPKGIILILMPLAFWMTYLMGPVCNFRYMIPLYVQYPLFIAAIVCPQRLFIQANYGCNCLPK